MLNAYLDMLELVYFELPFAFEGLADENVWKRPAAALLSIGELAGHIAYWEAVRLAGGGADAEKDLSQCRVSSPLIDLRFRYYPATLETPLSEQHRALTADQVCAELLRVHAETMADLKSLAVDPDSTVPGYPPDHTYREFLKYQAFHASYHAGQMYSVRHLLGDTPPDN